MIIDDKHISVVQCNDVKEICEPLFAKTCVRYFYHTRYYNDGTCYSLDSNTEWYKYFYSKDYYPTLDQLQKLPAIYYELFENYNSEGAAEARDQFKLDHFFAIYHVAPNYVDMFGMAADKDSRGVIDFYFKNLDILHQFIAYFKDRAQNLITAADKKENKLILPKFLNCSIQESSGFLTEDIIQPDKEELRHCLLPKKCQVIFNNINSFISKRELECLYNLLQGKSAKESARILNLSHRTVETHLENIKARFGILNRSQIIELAKTLSFNFFNIFT